MSIIHKKYSLDNMYFSILGNYIRSSNESEIIAIEPIEEYIEENLSFGNLESD